MARKLLHIQFHVTVFFKSALCSINNNQSINKQFINTKNEVKFMIEVVGG